MRIRCIILSFVASLALQYSSTLSNKTHKFCLKKLLNIKCAICFICKSCPKHFSFPEEIGEIWSKMFTGAHVKYPLFISYFDTGFWEHILETYSNIFIKILPVVAELFNADRQTSRPDEANSYFLWPCKQLEKKQVLLQYRIRATTNYSDTTITEW
jgi:hypothetical protein